jgi:hypothetical protein
VLQFQKVYSIVLISLDQDFLAEQQPNEKVYINQMEYFVQIKGLRWIRDTKP